MVFQRFSAYSDGGGAVVKNRVLRTAISTTSLPNDRTIINSSRHMFVMVRHNRSGLRGPNAF